MRFDNGLFIFNARHLLVMQRERILTTSFSRFPQRQSNGPSYPHAWKFKISLVMIRAVVTVLSLSAAAASAQDVQPLIDRCPDFPASEVAAIEKYDGPFSGLAWYARDMCVSLAEARRRMDVQHRDAVGPRTEPGPPPPPPPDSIGAVMMAGRNQEAATFAGLWIEHQPTYRVVVAFTQDAAATLAKYTDDPVFVPLDRPGPTLAELRATQKTIWQELTAIQARPNGTSTSEQTGRVKVGLAVDASVVRDAERAGRIRIPDYVDLIAPPPLSFDVPEPLPGDMRLIAFPRAYYRRSFFMDYPKPAASQIILRGGCLMQESEGNYRTIVWPNEAAADLSRPETVAIVNRVSGQSVAVGEKIALKGSAMPAGWDEPVVDESPLCPGPYIISTSPVSSPGPITRSERGRRRPWDWRASSGSPRRTLWHSCAPARC